MSTRGPHQEWITSTNTTGKQTVTPRADQKSALDFSPRDASTARRFARTSHQMGINEHAQTPPPLRKTHKECLPVWTPQFSRELTTDDDMPRGSSRMITGSDMDHDVVETLSNSVANRGWAVVVRHQLTDTWVRDATPSIDAAAEPERTPLRASCSKLCGPQPWPPVSYSWRLASL